MDAFISKALAVSTRVTTNGNGSGADMMYFTGRIIHVDYTLGYCSIRRDDGKTGVGEDKAWLIKDASNGYITIDSVAKDTTTKIKKSKLEVDRMFKEGVEDVKGFVKENRYVLYWVSLILLADHFIFGGELRGKIQALFNSIIDKVNSKINGDTPEAGGKG